MPLYAKCTPVITFSGFLNAHAAVGAHFEIPIYGPASERLAALAVPDYPVDVNGNTTNMSTTALWDNSEGTESLTVTVVQDLAAGVEHSFSFEVFNPAEGQAAPGISAEATGVPAASFSTTPAARRRLLDHASTPAMEVVYLNFDENRIPKP